jgi:hypothetical protein
MADILDPKQDVIKFELTGHGKRLLGMGLLQPEYVSFFDNNVIYDLSYAGGSEEQNDIQGRILNETITFGKLCDSEKYFNKPLGKSSMVSQYAPAWNIDIIRGTQNYVEVSSSYSQKYFILGDLKYSAELVDSDNIFFQTENVSLFELDNGKTIDIKEDYILLDISELNSDDDFKNFEVELYIENINTGKYKTKIKNNIDPEGCYMDQLYFYEKPTNIIDGILYEDNELPSKYRKVDIKNTDADYFLEVLVDGEIDKQLIESRTKPVSQIVAATYSSNFTGPAKDDC